MTPTQRLAWLADVVTDARLSPAALQVAIVLVAPARAKSEAQGRMAQRARLSVRSFRRGVRCLEEHGWLSLFRGDGRGKRNRYAPTFAVKEDSTVPLYRPTKADSSVPLYEHENGAEKGAQKADSPVPLFSPPTPPPMNTSTGKKRPPVEPGVESTHVGGAICSSFFSNLNRRTREILPGVDERIGEAGNCTGAEDSRKKKGLRDNDSTRRRRGGR